MTTVVPVEGHLQRPSKSRVPSRKVGGRRTRYVLGVGFVLLLLILPASAYAWTRLQYLSGTSHYGVLYGQQTAGALARQYNEAYHSSDDQWQVLYYLSDDSTIYDESTGYSDPTSLGATSTAVYSACQVLEPNSDGVAFDCATTVP